MSNVEVSIFLSSGHTITFVCDSFSIEKNASTGKYTGYTIEGSRNFDIISLSPSNIVGCTVKRIKE